MSSAAYVYGIVRADARPPSGRDVRVVAHGDLGALVADVPDEPVKGTREALLGHSEVLQGVAEETTVLPMRFGVVMPSEEAVRQELLERHGPRLRELLDRVEGRVQVSVRGFYEEDSLLREIVGEDRSVAKLRESIRGRPPEATYYERIRLGELVSEAVDRRRRADEELVSSRLGPLAVDSDFEGPTHERMAVNAAFLVERARLEEFGEAAAGLVDSVGDRVRLKPVGPLPPYNFVDVPLPTEEASWA